MKLEEVTNNLIKAVERYENVPLIDTTELSEVLRIIGVNLSYMVILRKHYYHEFQRVYFDSKYSTHAGKEREAMEKVPELDEIRKILRHFSLLQNDLRTQISLHKND